MRRAPASFATVLALLAALLIVLFAGLLAPRFDSPAVLAAADEVTEPRTGVRFPAHQGDMSLLGVGVRVKAITFIKVKVYAVGLYVADSALSGPLAAFKGKTSSPELYRTLVTGDFPKELRLRFVRDVDRKRIQEAMRESLAGADPKWLDPFIGYFEEVKSGQECVLRWAPGGTLQTSYAGAARPPLADKTFATAVFAIYLGDKPVQEDLKRDLVSRAPELIR
jgi:chalcone isomerase-like protein